MKSSTLLLVLISSILVLISNYSNGQIKYKYVTCGVCNGTRKVKCNVCFGKGKWYNSQTDSYQPCKWCGSTGWKKCDGCNGTGQYEVYDYSNNSKPQQPQNTQPQNNYQPDYSIVQHHSKPKPKPKPKDDYDPYDYNHIYDQTSSVFNTKPIVYEAYSYEGNFLHAENQKFNSVSVKSQENSKPDKNKLLAADDKQEFKTYQKMNSLFKEYHHESSPDNILDEDVKNKPEKKEKCWFCWKGSIEQKHFLGLITDEEYKELKKKEGHGDDDDDKDGNKINKRRKKFFMKTFIESQIKDPVIGATVKNNIKTVENFGQSLDKIQNEMVNVANGSSSEKLDNKMNDLPKDYQKAVFDAHNSEHNDNWKGNFKETAEAKYANDKIDPVNGVIGIIVY